MLTWLKNRLRRWLLEEGKPKASKPEPYLDCRVRIRGEWQAAKFLVTSCCGLRLVGSPVDNRGGDTVRLIDSSEAVDQKQFWALWKQFGGGGWTWEDGKPFEPGG